jgi:hypothetical protein
MDEGTGNDVIEPGKATSGKGRVPIHQDEFHAAPLEPKHQIDSKSANNSK